MMMKNKKLLSQEQKEYIITILKKEIEGNKSLISDLKDINEKNCWIEENIFLKKIINTLKNKDIKNI